MIVSHIVINFSLLDNFTNPLCIYLLYSFLFVIIFFVIIFEKPCLRKDNKGSMYDVCIIRMECMKGVIRKAQGSGGRKRYSQEDFCRD